MAIETSFENGMLTIWRRYDQPRDVVFAAWTEASQTRHWWGCAQTTQVTSEIEPRVGGKYVHEMHISGCGVHPIHGQLTAFDPPARLEYQMPGMAEGEAMQVTVEFIEKGPETEVRLTQSVVPDAYKGIIAAGWTAAMERQARFFDGERRAA